MSMNIITTTTIINNKHKLSLILPLINNNNNDNSIITTTVSISSIITSTVLQTNSIKRLHTRNRQSVAFSKIILSLVQWIFAEILSNGLSVAFSNGFSLL